MEPMRPIVTSKSSSDQWEHKDQCAAVTKRGQRCERESLGLVYNVPLCQWHDDEIMKSLRRRLAAKMHAELEAIALSSPQSAKAAVARGEQRRIINHGSPTVRRLLGDRRDIPQQMRRSIIDRDLQTCAYCLGLGDARLGPDGRVWHIDHLIPDSRGGGMTPDNLALACFTCNVKKRDRTDVEFRAYLGTAK